jgi:hypothetical protein
MVFNQQIKLDAANVNGENKINHKYINGAWIAKPRTKKHKKVLLKKTKNS